jgi:hypothetical protein
MFADHFQYLSRQASGYAHASDVFRGLDGNGHGRVLSVVTPTGEEINSLS